ncbi:unnamed protein product [Closterium sp. NIES-65]|nr:unnamed protein product [Closterium sp. NIES-65]
MLFTAGSEEKGHCRPRAKRRKGRSAVERGSSFHRQDKVALAGGDDVLQSGPAKDGEGKGRGAVGAKGDSDGERKGRGAVGAKGDSDGERKGRGAVGAKGDSDGERKGRGAVGAKGDSDGERKGRGAVGAKGDSDGERKGRGAVGAKGDSDGERKGRGAVGAKGDSDGERKGRGAVSTKGDSDGERKGRGAVSTKGDSDRERKGRGAVSTKGDSDGERKGRGAEVTYKRRKVVDTGGHDRKMRKARQGRKRYASPRSSSGSEEGSSDGESGSSSGSEYGDEEEEEEEEEESEDQDLEPESEEADEVRPKRKGRDRKAKKGIPKRNRDKGRDKGRKGRDSRGKSHGNNGRRRVVSQVVRVRPKVKPEPEFYAEMGVKATAAPTGYLDRKDQTRRRRDDREDPYAALRGPSLNAGKGADPLPTGSWRHNKEGKDPLAKRLETRDSPDLDKDDFKPKRYADPTAAAANDGVAGGMWANTLGDCGGVMAGSPYDERDERGDDYTWKRDPHTNEGRGESMCTPGASGRLNPARPKTVEQLTRELELANSELATLKAKPACNGVKNRGPPSQVPPLAPLESDPSSGGLSPEVADESTPTEGQPIRRRHGMPTLEKLRHVVPNPLCLHYVCSCSFVTPLPAPHCHGCSSPKPLCPACPTSGSILTQTPLPCLPHLRILTQTPLPCLPHLRILNPNPSALPAPPQDPHSNPSALPAPPQDPHSNPSALPAPPQDPHPNPSALPAPPQDPKPKPLCPACPTSGS